MYDLRTRLNEVAFHRPSEMAAWDLFKSAESRSIDGLPTGLILVICS